MIHSTQLKPLVFTQPAHDMTTVVLPDESHTNESWNLVLREIEHTYINLMPTKERLDQADFLEMVCQHQNEWKCTAMPATLMQSHLLTE